MDKDSVLPIDATLSSLSTDTSFSSALTADGHLWRQVCGMKLGSEGELYIQLAQGEARLKIQIMPVSKSGDTFLRTAFGAFGYSECEGISKRDAGRLVKRFAKALAAGQYQSLLAAFPHVAIPQTSPDEHHLSLRQELARLLGRSQQLPEATAPLYLDPASIVELFELHPDASTSQFPPFVARRVLPLSRGGWFEVLVLFENIQSGDSIRLRIGLLEGDRTSPYRCNDLLIEPFGAANEVISPEVASLCSRLVGVAFVSGRLLGGIKVHKRLGQMRMIGETKSIGLAEEVLNPDPGDRFYLTPEVAGLCIWDASQPESPGLHLRLANSEQRAIQVGRLLSVDTAVERLDQSGIATLDALVKRVFANEAMFESVALQCKAIDASRSETAAENSASRPPGKLLIGQMEGNKTARTEAAKRTWGIMFLQSRCYANCIFCGVETTEDSRILPVKSLIEELQQQPQAFDAFGLVGYEPLSHPGAFEVIQTAQRAGAAEIQLMTTGIPLGDLATCELLVQTGVSSVAVPLYSPTPLVNDAIMRHPNAFEQSGRGLDYLAQAGVEIFVHSLILRQNLQEIDALDSMVRQRWGARFVAAPPRSKTNFALVTPRYADVRAHVQKAPVVGLPLCLLPHMRQHTDLRQDQYLQFTLTEIAEVYRGYFLQGISQVAACQGCGLNSCCAGVIRHQFEVEPELELHALSIDNR